MTGQKKQPEGDAVKERKKKQKEKFLIFIAIFIIANILGIFLIGQRENRRIGSILEEDAKNTQTKFQEVLDNYEHSFQLFAEMMTQEIKNNPDPDQIWDYLKGIDKKMLNIEGDTFDGLYMYYQGRYLYSWDTPYSEYEKTGYVATERPWYKTAEEGNGKVVFTPPYMSYANNYILTTISQMQPDGETVFAYDIKMGDIQKLVSALNQYNEEQIMFFDSKGTIVGSTKEEYLGGNLYDSVKETEAKIAEAKAKLEETDSSDKEELDKIKDEINATTAFYHFREEADQEIKKIMDHENDAVLVKVGGEQFYGYLLGSGEFNFLILVPLTSILKATMAEWLVPFLILELLLIYILGRVSRDQKNRELQSAYIELGQTQRRLEIALNAAQKAAAVDELTGMMNLKSFKKGVVETLDSMDPDESGILVMIDGDNFKRINDNYGHNIGDEVIKLTAQMIIGRIRTEDLASRLHGDEYAIFIMHTDDYHVAKSIMEDINRSIAREAKKRNMPSITVSSGAVIAKNGNSFSELSKTADEALYQAKVTHDGGFAGWNVSES